MKFFLMYVLAASFFANQVLAAESSETPGSRRKSRSGQTSGRSGSSVSLEKRFDGLEAQLTHIVLMVNRNANDLKMIESRLSQQLITGNEADADAKKQIDELKVRVGHQTIQVSEAALKIASQMKSIQAQLTQHVITSNEQHVADSSATDKRLESITARLDHQTQTGNETARATDRQLVDLKARLSHQFLADNERKQSLNDLGAQLSQHIVASSEQHVTDSTATDKRIESLTARLDHQTQTGNETARATARQLTDLKARLSHQFLADNERKQRLDDLEARVSHETIKGSELAHKAAQQLTDVEARLDHQILAANDQGHRLAKVETNVVQQINATGGESRAQIAQVSAESSENTPELLPSGADSSTKPVARKPRRNRSIEARLIRVIALLEQQNRE